MIDRIGLSADDIAVAKQEVSAKHAAQFAQLKADRAREDAEILASQNPTSPEVEVDGAHVNA